MNSSPPRTNSTPSQMTSILASARLYSPKPLARLQYHQSPKAAWSHSQPLPVWSAASYGCERKCSRARKARRNGRGSRPFFEKALVSRVNRRVCAFSRSDFAARQRDCWCASDRDCFRSAACVLRCTLLGSRGRLRRRSGIFRPMNKLVDRNLG